MSRRLKVLVCVVLVLFVGSAVGTALVLKPSESRVVEIVQDGEVLYTVDLATSGDRDIDVEYHGSHNVVHIEGGEVCVSSADCDDHTCMNMGTLKSESLPIVCLPNRLIVRFRSED